jgi:hypothetical protein
LGGMSPNVASKSFIERLHEKGINDPWVVAIIHAIVILPFIILLGTIKRERDHYKPYNQYPTPYGYTWSLSIFIVPVVVMVFWLLSRPNTQIQKRAFWWAATILSSLGIILDVCFGTMFLTFDNHDATLKLPNWWSLFRFPIEEIVFYVSGIMCVLLLYIWGDEVWFGAYNKPDTKRDVKGFFEGFHYGSFAFSCLGIAAAWLYKDYLAPIPRHPGFPGYFTFLTVVAFLPTLLLFNVVREFINWRSFSFVAVYILLVSTVWEAFFGLPYGWWGYAPASMIGISIKGFYGLPIEAVLVWIAVSWTSVIVYEYISVCEHRAKAQRAGNIFDI